MTNAKVSSIIDIEKLKAEKALTAKKCCVEGCENIGMWRHKTKTFCLAKGMCAKHYMRFKTHGDPNIVLQIKDQNRFNHPLYHIYIGMIKRCNSPNDKSFRDYGKRGISVAAEWQGLNGFSQFLIDMGERPEGYSIDRKDVNGNYSKGNCQWASRHQQQANKRNNNKTVGVHYDKLKTAWVARIRVNKASYQRLFKNEQDAIDYRVELEKKYL